METQQTHVAMVMAREEFVEVTGISPERLQELLALGWLEERPDGGGPFREADIYRVRKLERICCDFDLPVLGGTIIVDLLERIDMLERALKGLQDKE
ncbi:MAG: chaperone modulator CbpM [Desulfovibrionaceae bacterium]|nr:chaperone modulator CbpM [Desulfovibrionaceae bacterium]